MDSSWDILAVSVVQQVHDLLMLLKPLLFIRSLGPKASFLACIYSLFLRLEMRFKNLVYLYSFSVFFSLYLLGTKTYYSLLGENISHHFSVTLSIDYIFHGHNTAVK